MPNILKQNLTPFISLSISGGWEVPLGTRIIPKLKIPDLRLDTVPKSLWLWTSLWFRYFLLIKTISCMKIPKALPISQNVNLIFRMMSIRCHMEGRQAWLSVLSSPLHNSIGSKEISRNKASTKTYYTSGNHSYI